MKSLPLSQICPRSPLLFVLSALLTISYFVLNPEVSLAKVHPIQKPKALAEEHNTGATTNATVILALNETHKLTAPPGQNIHVNHGRSIKVIDQGRHVRIYPKRTGETWLLSGTKRTKIIVVRPEEKDFLQTVHGLLKNRMGLKVRFGTSTPQIYGRLLRWRDWQDIARIAQEQSVEYDFIADIDRDQKPKILKHLHHLQKQSALPHFSFSLRPKPTFSISQGHSGQLEAWNLSLRPLGLKAQLSEKLHNLEPTVRTQIWVAEVNKSWSRVLGVKWPQSVEYSLHPAAQLSSLEASLHALDDNGQGQVLASPVLLNRSRTTGEFLAGGEFPIRLQTAFGTRGVTWKKHGIFLKITPVVDAERRIRLELKTEISTLDFSQQIDGLPSIKTNRVHTHFDVSDGQTIVISGFTQALRSQAQSGLPWLSQIPVLGYLFSSKNFQNKKTELVVIVKPSLVAEKKNTRQETFKEKMPSTWSDFNEMQ